MIEPSVSEMLKATPRWLFWLILSCLSVFFAEVVTGSHVYGVISIWGIVSLIPLYGLHAVILATICHRHGVPRLPVLVSAGAVFGLYEAYITKVIWDPFFQTPHIKIIGLDVVALFWVILAYHPLMSFVVPVAVADALCLHTGQWRRWTPGWIRRPLMNPQTRLRTVAIMGLAAGLFNCSTRPQGGAIMVAIFMVLNAGLIALLVRRWNQRTGGKMLSMKQVLPRYVELLGMGIGLCLVFIIQGGLLRVAFLPAIQYQLSVWLLYALFFWLMWRGSEPAYVARDANRAHNLQNGPKALVMFALCMGVATIIGEHMWAPIRAVCLIVTMAWIVGWSWWMYMKAFRLAYSGLRKRVRRRSECIKENHTR